MFPLTRSTGSKKQSRLAAHAPFSCRLTARTSIPSNNSSQGSNRSYAKSRRALLRSFGEQSPLFSKGFPKKNAKLISQTQDTPNLIEKCSRRKWPTDRENFCSLRCAASYFEVFKLRPYAFSGRQPQVPRTTSYSVQRSRMRLNLADPFTPPTYQKSHITN